MEYGPTLLSPIGVNGNSGSLFIPSFLFLFFFLRYLSDDDDSIESDYQDVSVKLYALDYKSDRER